MDYPTLSVKYCGKAVFFHNNNNIDVLHDNNKQKNNKNDFLAQNII